MEEKSILSFSRPTGTVLFDSLTGRWGALAIASALLTLMLISCWLRPSSSGTGTHQQLGLPPCTAKVLWGMRCPACGMTTSWAHFVRGSWRQSVQANPGGFVLALQTAVTIPVLLLRGVRESPLTKQFWWATALTVIFAFSAASIDWIMRLLA